MVNNLLPPPPRIFTAMKRQHQSVKRTLAYSLTKPAFTSCFLYVPTVCLWGSHITTLNPFFLLKSGNDGINFARLLLLWEELYLKCMAYCLLKRSPQYMLGFVGGFFFFLIVGQLLWKQSFLLLEITCIKGFLTSYSLSDPLQFEVLCLWGWQRSPVTIQSLASLVFDIMGLLFLLKMLSSLAFMDFLFDLFASSSWPNPKCWCSFSFCKFFQAVSSPYTHRIDYCL